MEVIDRMVTAGYEGNNNVNLYSCYFTKVYQMLLSVSVTTKKRRFIIPHPLFYYYRLIGYA